MTAPTPVARLSEALTVTLKDRSVTTLFNQYAKTHPAWDILKSNFKSQQGGEGMVLPIKGTNTATTAYSDKSGAVAVPLTADNISDAEYDFSAPEVGQVRLRWIDLERNTGKNRIIDRLQSHREDLEEAFRVSFIQKMHQSHGARGANDPFSLDSLTNASVSGIGGIDTTGGQNAYWNPLTVDATGVTDPKALLRSLKMQMQKRTNGQGMPKVILADERLYTAILEYLDDHAAITGGIGGSAGDLEWESVRFDGVEVRYDWDCPAGVSYFLNPTALHFRYLNGLWMKHLGTDRVDEVRDVAGIPTLFQTQDYSYKVASLLSVGTNERRTLGQIRNFGGASV